MSEFVSECVCVCGIMIMCGFSFYIAFLSPRRDLLLHVSGPRQQLSIKQNLCTWSEKLWDICCDDGCMDVNKRTTIHFDLSVS